MAEPPGARARSSRTERKEEIQREVAERFRSQSEHVKQIIYGTRNLDDVRERLEELFKKREDSGEFPPLKHEELELIAEYDSQAWPYYPGILRNTEFWFFVAESYATIRNKDEPNHDVPPRGLVLP